MTMITILGSLFVFVYGAGWVALALPFAHYCRHRDDEPWAITVCCLWPVIWPGVLAFIIYRWRENKRDLDARVARAVQRKLAERERYFEQLERKLLNG